ncbi:golgin subfamily A member 1-like protein [Dinothrombium tinctorium]|uniref:Golgin subfamily A member 1-like protein n=1 Tax=Dinothrombium tinctorium TaxID=1965070 RepID=A0A3S3NX32_9ACAR|nr:golgin subfamily A member 1-like protein [Dinothrombium tinctorium]RWS00418.1 golgin subfamily A member 1-like protein [Dinothrombium tinctorium]
MFKRLKEQKEAGSVEKVEKNERIDPVNHPSNASVSKPSELQKDDGSNETSSKTIVSKQLQSNEVQSKNVEQRSRTTSISEDFVANSQKTNDRQFFEEQMKQKCVLQQENDSLNKEIEALRTDFEKVKNEKDFLLNQNTDLFNIIESLKKDLEIEKKSREDIRRDFESFKESCRVNHSQEDTNDCDDSLIVKNLKETVSKLENELNDKIKIIRLQHQKMKDMKKSLENGDLLPLKKKGFESPMTNANLDVYDTCSSTDNSPKLIRKVESNNKLNSTTTTTTTTTETGVFNEISFQYLKNIVFKFVTSSEYEAQHLIKAISVLLKFNAEEEQCIRDTLEWRMSWFKNLPIVGSGLKPVTSQYTKH